MSIPHETVLQLTKEGITAVMDLADFDKPAIQQITDNLRKPGDCIPNPDANDAPATCQIPDSC